MKIQARLLKNVDQDAWDVELAFNEGDFYAGILYGQFDASPNVSSAITADTQTDVIEIAASYVVGNGKFGAGAAFNDGDGREESTSYYLNYGYNLLTNCRVYTEVGF